MKKRTVRLLAATAVAMFMVFSMSGAGFAGTVKLGVAGPHSGDLASYGIPTLSRRAVVKTSCQRRVLGKREL